MNGDLWQTLCSLNLRSRCPWHRLDGLHDLCSHYSECTDMFTENFDGNILPYTSHQLIEPHLDGLVCFKKYTWNALQPLNHQAGEFLITFGSCPFFFIL